MTPDSFNYEKIDHSLFDTVVYPHNEWIERLDFFVIPWGNNGKTQLETNMVFGSSLPAPQKYIVKGISFTFLDRDSTFDDYKWEICRTGMFQFIIGNKLYFTCAPLAQIYTMPEGLQYGKVFSVPFGIPSLESFNASMQWPRPVSKKRKNSYSIRVQLNGELIRPIQ